jgi:hypothetical protein
VSKNNNPSLLDDAAKGFAMTGLISLGLVVVAIAAALAF